MKKQLISCALILLCISVPIRANNQNDDLNQMVVTTIGECIKWEKSLPFLHRPDGYIYNLSWGLPHTIDISNVDFSDLDSLGNIRVIHYNRRERRKMFSRKQLYAGFWTKYVRIVHLQDNRFTISATSYWDKVKCRYSVSEISYWTICTFAYSCEEHKWVLVKTEHGGI